MEYTCGCKTVMDLYRESLGWQIKYCPKHEAAEDMYEALKELPEPKSLLADAAYTGGDVSKSWIRDRGNWNDGYNQALKDVAKLREQALAKAGN